jgi:hypothetical protein
MKNVSYFLLGIALVVLTSATTVSVMTVKPATPKSTICFTTKYQSVSSEIISYSTRGYSVKFISGITDRYEGQNFVTVVMEKY